MVCDDDVHVRAAVRLVAEQMGHEVVAETDTAVSAIDFLRREVADAAVVDLALAGGTGHEVLRAAAELGAPAVVFSAYVNDVDAGAYTNRPVLVSKPDFSDLVAALQTLDDHGRQQPVERRRDSFVRLRAPETEEAHEFYAVLNEAWPGDVLLGVRAEREPEASTSALAMTVRAAIRGHDRVLRRSDDVLALLFGGEPDATRSVIARIAEKWSSLPEQPALVARSVTVGADEAPADAFARLREVEEVQLATWPGLV